MNVMHSMGPFEEIWRKSNDILRQKIAKSESSRGLSLRDRISKVFERLVKFTAKLTTEGKTPCRRHDYGTNKERNF